MLFALSAIITAIMPVINEINFAKKTLFLFLLIISFTIITDEVFKIESAVETITAINATPNIEYNISLLRKLFITTNIASLLSISGNFINAIDDIINVSVQKVLVNYTFYFKVWHKNAIN